MQYLSLFGQILVKFTQFGLNLLEVVSEAFHHSNYSTRSDCSDLVADLAFGEESNQIQIHCLRSLLGPPD